MDLLLEHNRLLPDSSNRSTAESYKFGVGQLTGGGLVDRWSCGYIFQAFKQHYNANVYHELRLILLTRESSTFYK